MLFRGLAPRPVEHDRSISSIQSSSEEKTSGDVAGSWQIFRRLVSRPLEHDD